MNLKRARIAAWIARLVAVAILGMAAVPKLTSQPEAIALFQTLGVEPWGRWLVGTAEVVIVVLLLIGRTAAYGGVLALILMSGALGAHLFKLGVVYNGDATLFILATVVLVAAAIVVFLRRHTLGRRTGLSPGPDPRANSPK